MFVPRTGEQVLQLEEIAEKPSRAVGDDDDVRLGPGLAGAPQGSALHVVGDARPCCRS